MRVESETGGNELSWILSNKELSRFQLLGEHTKVVAVLILTNSQGPRFRLARAKNGQEIDGLYLAFGSLRGKSEVTSYGHPFLAAKGKISTVRL